ncbi:sulfurtransferase DndC [Aneurinibacillus migulanus]|uniref:DNA phosphorothioation system sulfurtransferase DndC n=1 Tax=Aneurinibacillus migulanus TaxID=47500 RepID=UPI0005BB2D45|nr:DNA phosphorothioation system sulfurtransferase DndC [Aneurinibacillus migulanus]KIV56066.1 sulfurtransferase DndC [Aneurinibacillus migulanus]KPD06590.1 sulfurtransferase DndC [Aneurinibacillus migulanus]CEH29395.1 Sulfurtransferase DndC [Aneurinibacillus migulanus]
MNLFENEKITFVKQQIKNMYVEDERPWVVGYSGGKDSTVVVQLIFEALSELKQEQTLLNKKVYVISSDTLVETPLIISFINRTLMLIQDKAIELGLPIETHKVKPEIEKSFWAMLIGKGYPSPRQKFRWCTDRLKIEPANRFILDKVSTFGEVIMVLGVRDSESQTRAQVMESHTVAGKVLMRHSSLPNAFVYAPIRNFDTNDVWSYLLEYESPWGNDNHQLLTLYQNSDSECPLIVDKEVKESAGSCGNSRFGCWVCTVVQKDKALIGFIDKGEDWMIPLLKFRDRLYDIRSERGYRQKRRMNGQVYLTPVSKEEVELTKYQKVKQNGEEYLVPLIKGSGEEYRLIKEEEIGEYLKMENVDLDTIEDSNILIEEEEGTYKRLGLGPFTLEARKYLLRLLLETQKEVHNPYDPSFELISIEDLKVIRKYWLKDGDWEDSLPGIYHEVMNREVDWEYDDRPPFEEDQITDLELLCQEYNVSFSLLKELIQIEKKYSGYKIRRGLQQEFERAFRQDWLHV